MGKIFVISLLMQLSHHYNPLPPKQIANIFYGLILILLCFYVFRLIYDCKKYIRRKVMYIRNSVFFYSNQYFKFLLAWLLNNLDMYVHLSDNSTFISRLLRIQFVLENLRSFHWIFYCIFIANLPNPSNA